MVIDISGYANAVKNITAAEAAEQVKRNIASASSSNSNTAVEQKQPASASVGGSNKLKKENAGYVKDSDSQTGSGFPNVRIIYIGGTDNEKEAILSIDGTSYSVKGKDKPISNMEILSVTEKSVWVHFNAPQEITTEINYVQE